MVIAPQTEIRLVKVPLSLSNKNQLTFENTQKQFEYFNSLEHITMDNATYVRKDDRIYFDGKFDDLIKFDYVMYQNESYSNKWFYAFILDMRYENNSTTSISIKTDVWQTWQFDIIYKQSFIEREMLAVSEDVPGANLLPESLEIGELKIGGTAEFDNLETVSVVAYSGDQVPGGITGALLIDLEQGGYTVNGITQSIVFLICENEWYDNLMNRLQQETYSEYIISCFSVPKLAVQDFMIPENRLAPNDYIYVLQGGNTYTSNPVMKTLVSTPSTLDGYTPRNQKLRTYPYMYIGFNPNNGSSKIYRYEDFANGTPQFKLISEVNPNPTICFIPQNYRGQSGDSLSDISTMNGYPTLSSRNDYYNSWLAQNSEIISLQMQQEQYNYEIGQVQTGLNMLGGIAGGLTGNPSSAGGIITGAISLAQNDVNHDFYIKQQMAQIEKQSLLPDKANLSSSNATLIGYNLVDKNIFTRYTIKSQFAERIDKYFDMFGYLTNKVKVPNTNNRPNWNYVKTLGINILGDIPQIDLAEIKELFDNGITLWHNTNTFLDYSQNNR